MRDLNEAAIEELGVEVARSETCQASGCQERPVVWYGNGQHYCQRHDAIVWGHADELYARDLAKELK